METPPDFEPTKRLSRSEIIINLIDQALAEYEQEIPLPNKHEQGTI